MPSQITTHVVDAIASLPSRDKGKTNIEGLVTIFAQRAQTIENTLWSIYSGFVIDSATGDLLDKVGEIVGVARNELADADYRLRIRAEIKINDSNGTLEELLTVTRLLINDSSLSIYLFQHYPAILYMEIYYKVMTDAEASALMALLRRVPSAGVGFHLTYSTDTEDEMFAFTPLSRVDGAHGSGASSIAASIDLSEFPTSGFIDIGRNTGNEELDVEYSNRSADTFYLVGTTANAHADTEDIQLSEGATGKGFGDETLPASVGGLLAGIII